MRWEKLRRSKNVEDRRSQTSRTSRGGNSNQRGGGNQGGQKRPLAMRGGCGSILLVILLAFFFKVDPSSILGGDSGQGLTTQHPQQRQASSQTSTASDQFQHFIENIKGSNEDVWTAVFAKYGKEYRIAKMVSYTGTTRMRTGGIADSRMGPFYLPAEETIYLDLHFFQQMATQFNARGDFAYAYVIAHEVAHHVQKLLGQTQKVHGKQGRVSQTQYNQLSVRLELQADFLAGVWAHYADKQMIATEGHPMLQPGDIEEAMRAATAIGDDALQRQSGNRVVEDSFTHGTSEQRLRWFMKGYQSGDLNQADTFKIPYNSL